MAAKRNPQGHASCYANLADILSGGIGWSLPKKMAKSEHHIKLYFPKFTARYHTANIFYLYHVTHILLSLSRKYNLSHFTAST
ncbi:MAG: hypothetical protein K2K43_05030 [Alistipes sp.]|nr:hypothetical protein [Alistipes sp.]